MPESYLTGPLLIVAIVLGWLAVQTAWARAFAGEADDDPDPLAARNCEGCGCLLACRRRRSDFTKESPR